jgi:hypothetical protein
MRSKPAELSAGLVAIKGAAAPSPDMPGRAGPSPAPQVVPPAAANTSAPPKAAARATARAKAAPAAVPDAKEANFTPLNFRIPASFRREFRTYAATHDLKLNELLRLCFEAYRRQKGD